MAITKREFLKALGIWAAALALKPLEVLANEGRSRILVDGYVHRISGDKLSDSFHKDEKHGLWVPLYDKVRNFYSHNFDIHPDQVRQIRQYLRNG